MRVIRLILCLLLIGLFCGCGGGGQQAANNQLNTKLAKVLVNDQLVTHANDDPATPLADDQTQPAVAYDTVNNKYLVVWTDYTNVLTNGTDIYAALCTGAGTGTGTTMSCSNKFAVSSGTGNQAQSKVAFYNDSVTPANSKYLVVWTDTRSGDYSQIYGQFITAAGALSGPNFKISSHTDLVDINQSDPDIIYDKVKNKFVVAWLDVTTHDTAKAMTLQGATCYNTVTYNYIPLPIADNYLVRTTEVSTTGAISNLQHTSELVITDPVHEVAGGKAFTGSWNVQFNESKPKISYSSVNGDYYVAWAGMNHSVTFNSTYKTTPLTTTFNKSRAGGGVWAAGDSVSLTAATEISAVADVTAFGGTVGLKEGAVTNYSVAGVNTKTVIVTINAGSNLIGSDAGIKITVSYFRPDSCDYSAATFSGTDTDAGKSKIKIRKNTGLGLVQDFSFGTQAVSPTVAVDPNTNRVLVAWEEQSGSDKNILGQLVDLGNFVNYGSGISISSAAGDQSSPAASFDNVNQRFLVVWEDARNQSANLSNIDIYGQFVDPQGNLSGGNTVVTVANGNQLAPAVAFGDVDFRQFFVVFKDGRDPSNSEIYGQLLEFSTLPQLLIEDSSGIPILNGSIDFGNVVVGQNKDIGFKICNDGNSQLTINDISSPDAPYSFTITNPDTINPGTCYDMNARFAPVAAGTYAGSAANNFKTTIDSNGGQVTLFFSGNGTGIQDLAITTTELPDGSTGSTYSATLKGFGGASPYSWSVVGRTINTGGCTNDSYPLASPNNGLCLSAKTGVISGTPTTGTVDFTVKLTDNAAKFVTKAFTINVSVINITTSSLKPWTQGVEYGKDPKQQLTATGGTEPYSWIISGGTLPDGIVLNPDGSFTGVPTKSGTFTFTVKATDSSPTPLSATRSLSITITGGVVVPPGNGGGISTGGGGCSLGGRQNVPTAFADTAVMLAPLFVIIALRIIRRRRN